MKLPKMMRIQLRKVFLSPTDKKVIYHLQNRNEESILFCGAMKSGNTWARFLLYNYINILRREADKPMTFRQLNETQPHVLEYGSTIPFIEKFPPFYRTHLPHLKVFNHFAHRIYIWRNPLDALVSLYYYALKRDIPFRAFPKGKRKDLQNIDFFVVYTLANWINHFNSTYYRSSIILQYEQLKANPIVELRSLCRKLGIHIDEPSLGKAVAFSSFSRIKAMGRENNQSHGMASQSTFQGEFARRGKVGGFRDELKPSTIDMSVRQLRKSGFHEELMRSCALL